MHEITEEIQLENQWRESEFARFKTNPDKVNDNLWNRMCVPMIYAHWEGYVHSSIKILIKYLNKKKLQSSEVKTKLLVQSLNKSYGFLSGKQSFTQRLQFTENFEKLLVNEFYIEAKVDTKSNLKAAVLNDICIGFDFNFEIFSPQSPVIDRLVHVRNAIAHGQNSYVLTNENIQNFITAVQKNSDCLLAEIESFLLEEKYLKTKVEVHRVTPTQPL